MDVLCLNGEVLVLRTAGFRDCGRGSKDVRDPERGFDPTISLKASCALELLAVCRADLGRRHLKSRQSDRQLSRAKDRDGGGLYFCPGLEPCHEARVKGNSVDPFQLNHALFKPLKSGKLKPLPRSDWKKVGCNVKIKTILIAVCDKRKCVHQNIERCTLANIVLQTYI